MRGYYRKAKSAYLALFIFVGLISVSALAVVLGGVTLRDAATQTLPSPAGKTSEQEASDEATFPFVDWEYWQAINPDVMGWITIPGTAIDYPIVQAQPNDPLRYLSHDVYGNWNPFGAIFLDAECADAKLQSKNVGIYGHNMGFQDHSMFADICRFSDTSFVQEYSSILIQTPQWQRVVEVDLVDVAQGWEERRRCIFETESDYQHWYRVQQKEADIVRYPDREAPLQNYTLVTCSYQQSDNERTIVCAS